MPPELQNQLCDCGCGYGYGWVERLGDGMDRNTCTIGEWVSGSEPPDLKKCGHMGSHTKLFTRR